MEPLWPQQDFFSLYEFARRHQIGLTTIYAEIKAGRLTARKIGRRTVIAAMTQRLGASSCRECDQCNLSISKNPKTVRMICDDDHRIRS